MSKEVHHPAVSTPVEIETIEDLRVAARFTFGESLPDIRDGSGINSLYHTPGIVLAGLIHLSGRSAVTV